MSSVFSSHWRHHERAGVSNHQPHDCLLNGLFRCRSKKTSKLRVNGLCAGNSPGPVNSPHKGPVTRKMFPFDDVIMYRDKIIAGYWGWTSHICVTHYDWFGCSCCKDCLIESNPSDAHMCQQIRPSLTQIMNFWPSLRQVIIWRKLACCV